MRKTIFLLIAIVLIITGCKGSQADIDLTALNKDKMFVAVSDMGTSFTRYEGKTVRICGHFDAYKGTAQDYYFAVVVEDSDGCCHQGLEFVLDDEAKYPENYPEIGSEITVTGTFETYREGLQLYCHLAEAHIE